MAPRSGICNSFRLEAGFEGVHDFRVDTVKAALYTSASDIGPLSTAYTATNEASGTGYTAGGFTLPVTSGYPKLLAAAMEPGLTYPAGLAFDSVSFGGLTITFRAVLLYNASKANRAIAVLDRGVDVVLTAGPLVFFTNPTNPALLKVA